ncbi:LuxR C-terminal-related transcriptional regulator [Hydrogenophaga sp.]|jgi:DNA-binding NarL/FixJ family response regulator|uniref:LuxR C-terminal-related transcriptional regulator n=1 Tax=Hydrogenophaga sp. TaxID=1904254 RepID=UPI003F707896
MSTLAPSPLEIRQATTLLVVDDHDLLRLGLLTLVQAHATGSGRPIPVLESRTLQEALDLYREHEAQIGLVLLDLHLPDAHGLTGLTNFLKAFPQAPVVVLSGVNDPGLMRYALSRGARAYLTKSGDLKEVISYIRALGMLGSPALGSTAPPREPVLRTVRNTSGETLQLTERQAQVLDCILAGESNRDIAERAQLSEGTVKNHVSALLLLFGVRSRAQLISTLR